MPVTFPVDDVVPAAEPLPTEPLGGLYPDAVAAGGDPGLPVVAPDGIHPLLSAVARAFAEHRPLTLSPDAVWLTITHGIAHHVRLHAEELRPLLAGHDGLRRRTVTTTDPIPDDAAGWARVISAFETPELFDCAFSTSTDVDRIAGRVIALDAVSPYYTLWLRSICGIPVVTLTGTPADWRIIRSRVDGLAALGLAHWARSLAPILDECVRAVEGRPDRDFWRRIYKPAEAYGGDLINGWIARLYPYLAPTAHTVPNPVLDLPLDATAGIQSVDVPATLARVIINATDEDVHRFAVHAGLVAVAQDPDGALRPVAGWHVTRAELTIDEVLDRVIREHETTPAREETYGDAPPDVVGLYHRIGSATLFGGRWRIPPWSERRPVAPTGLRPTGPAGTAEADDAWAETLVELDDGRSIIAITRWDEPGMPTHYALARVAGGRIADDPARVPLLGTSLPLLLQAALDSGGDVTHLETRPLGAL